MKKDKWPFIVIILAFIISLCMTFISNFMLNDVELFFAILITLIFIFVGILFDIVGVAVTSADITPFHSMASRKIKYGKIGVKLLKNTSRVSSICCDVIGDVSGIVSGTCSVVIVTLFIIKYDINPILVSLIVPAIISSITIGGKAFGKNIAINKSNYVIELVAKIISIFVFFK